MKTRLGFVSNSSSSSFIIQSVSEKSGVCKCCGRPYGELFQAITNALQRTNDYENDLKYWTNDPEEMKEHLLDSWGFKKGDQEGIEWANDVLEKAEPGKDLVHCHVSYHDEILNDMICNNPKEIKVVYDFG